jgi:hypothetical protein
MPLWAFMMTIVLVSGMVLILVVAVQIRTLLTTLEHSIRWGSPRIAQTRTGSTAAGAGAHRGEA